MLITIAQLMLSLSILIVLHEMGHFIPAKAFKTRVEKFYLFFDPWFSIFKKKIGETEYGIGWLPLGGYVKISGMVDESMDTEKLKEPAKPWEFRSKPAWQRLIIMIGGVTVNVILAFFIYAMVLFAWGKEYIPVENLKYGVYADSLMLENGFQHGDRILKVGEIIPETLNDVNKEVLFGDERDIEFKRDGQIKTIRLPEDIDQQMLARGTQSIFSYRYPAIIDTIVQGSNADTLGLVQKGDQIIEMNGQAINSYPQLREMMFRKRGHDVELVVIRNGDKVNVTAPVDSANGLGIYSFPQMHLDSKELKYGFFESFPAGVKEGTQTLVSYVRSLKLIFSKQGVKQVGGFGTIAGLFGERWNWHNFWTMTALLSIILAVMNLLPIPALDGGHVMFLLYEMISGRTPNQKVLEYAQLVGFAILITLLLYANGNDILKSDWFQNLFG